MKRKFLPSKKYQKIIKPAEKLSYSRKSPFDPITPPPTTVFIAWHGSEALMLNCGTGTTYVCRKDDNDPKPLNFDVYSIVPTKNPKIIEIKNLPKQEYHWAEDAPQFIKGSAPKWVKEEIKKILKNRSGRNEATIPQKGGKRAHRGNYRPNTGK